MSSKVKRARCGAPAGQCVNCPKCVYSGGWAVGGSVARSWLCLWWLVCDSRAWSGGRDGRAVYLAACEECDNLLQAAT